VVIVCNDWFGLVVWDFISDSFDDLNALLKYFFCGPMSEMIVSPIFVKYRTSHF